MADVVFVRPRHDYQSYTDLYALIQLSGFQLIYADELDPASDIVYIVTIYNGETQGGWPGARARIVLWDFEWRTEPLPPMLGVAEVWYADAWQAQVAGGRYVPMGSDKRLAAGAGVTSWMQYDVAFLGYVVSRREAVLNQLKDFRLRMPPTSMWGAERDTVLRASRAYLHIHQHDHAPGLPALRLAVAAAYGLPFITEAVANAGMFGPSVLLSADYAHLARLTAMWAGDDNPALRDRGHALHRLLCEDVTFRKSVEVAL